MACAFINSNSRSANRLLIRTHLPTLTPTPLPTLAPTVVAISAPVSPAQAEVSAPTPASPNNDQSVLPLTENQTSSESLLTALVKLNVRAGPGLDYPVVGRLVQGQSIQIIGKNPEGTWWQVIYPDRSGNLAWVSADSQYSTIDNVGQVAVAQLPPPPPPTATATQVLIVETPPVQPIESAEPADAPTTGPTDAPTAQLQETPTPALDSTVEPTVTPASASPGWAFAGVRLYPAQHESGLVLYGNIINNTGSPQELISITGTFQDAQGQTIAGPDETHAYWPGYVVLPGGSVPFELFVSDIDNPANFNLSAEAEHSSELPRQDFEFADVDQKNEQEAYCLEGELKIRGDEPEDYLVIAAVLYDSQDNVVNFGDYSEFGVDDDEVDFEICINPPNQEVARYELRAWGF